MTIMHDGHLWAKIDTFWDDAAGRILVFRMRWPKNLYAADCSVFSACMNRFISVSNFLY